MNTMEITKIVGGLSGALLIYLLVNWAGESLYHVETEAHGKETSIAPADIYVAEVVKVKTTETSSDEPSFDELLASADITKGAKVFAKCKACHKIVDGKNATGPHLFGIVDRVKANVEGFSYSGGLKALGGNWDIAALDEFLTKPRAMVSDTKMSFAGLRKIKDRANLIAYLQTIK